MPPALAGSEKYGTCPYFSQFKHFAYDKNKVYYNIKAPIKGVYV